MKSLLLSVYLTAISTSASAQGTVYFSNHVPGVDAPVYYSDRITQVSGSKFMAELLAGSTANSLAPIASTGFLTGNAAGYFNGGIQNVPIIASQLAWVQVQVWNTASGASFDQAVASGLPDSWWTSSVFSLHPGDPTIPTLPAALVGLGNSAVYLNTIPEPSTFALAGLGAAIATFLIRRNWLGVVTRLGAK